MVSFNPRTHTGCDLSFGFNDLCPSVSIHAPTRGATYTTNVLFDRIVFQSTHPHGVRPAPLNTAAFARMFQSTHPHGVRRFLLWSIKIIFKFQSTHPHGVRHIRLKTRLARAVFQSTHPHGVRHSSKRARTIESSFNPRTHTGCDSKTNGILTNGTEFQSTHPHGVRPCRLRDIDFVI